MSVERVEAETALSYAVSLTNSLRYGEASHKIRAEWARRAARYLQTYARAEESKDQQETKQP